MKRPPLILLANCPTTSRIYAGIQAIAKRENWDLLVEEYGTELLNDWNGDGAMINPGSSPSVAAIAQRLANAGVAVVSLSAMNTPAISGVATDCAAIGRLAAEHYTSRSFTHLAFFSRQKSCEADILSEAFRDAANPATFLRLPSSEQNAKTNIRNLRERLADALLNAPKPLGVFCHSDLDAMMVINACEQSHLAIPEDVSILGIGDNPAICETECVPLSSIRIDEYRLGLECAEMLRTRLKHRHAKRRTVCVPPICIQERQTTDALGTNDPLLRNALKYIDNHIDRPMGGAEIAMALSVPRGRLDRTFAGILGRSAGQEIVRQRILKAKNLLMTSHSIAETAKRTGFCNAAYFVVTFRKATGLTPVAWRKTRKSTQFAT